MDREQSRRSCAIVASTRASTLVYCTPPRSSRLNRFENGFARNQPAVIAHRMFTWPMDLAKKPMRYIRQYDTRARSIKCKDDNSANRIRSKSSGSVD